MGHRCGVRDEGFYSAETFAKRAEFYALEKPFGVIEAAEVERDHATEPRHLLLREIVARMSRQTGVINLLHFFLSGQVVRDLYPIFVVGIHPNRQCFDSAQ